MKLTHIVKPQSENRTIGLLLKTTHALNEIRYSIGAIENKSETISEPGSYVLGQDIQGNLTINADDVVLDLNKCKVYSNIDTTTLITIKGGCRNIAIINGTIKGSGILNSLAHGIYIEPGANIIEVQNVKIMDVQHGIHFDGNQIDTPTQKCFITKCIFYNCKKAIVLNYVTKSIFKTCNALQCQETGFELYKSNLNRFEACQVLHMLNNDPDMPIFGFRSTLGSNNLFLHCIVKKLEKILSNATTNTTGFSFEGEIGSRILNSLINNIKISGSGNAYGINLLESSIHNSIVQNQASNIRADANGIGIEGNDTENIIMQNISYANKKAYGLGITLANIYTEETTGSPGNLQNIEVSTY